MALPEYRKTCWIIIMEMMTKLKRMIPVGLKYKLIRISNSINNRKMLRYYKRVLPYQSGKYPQGINLIGNVYADNGVGQGMRVLAEALYASHIPFTVIPTGESVREKQQKENDFSWKEHIGSQALYHINVIYINIDKWAKELPSLSCEILNERYNIAYWAWELETIPVKWKPCLQTVDEVWMLSEFSCNSLRKYTDKAVVKIPPYINIHVPVKYGRKYFALPEKCFLFLTMLDVRSISERKNPQGVIRAFKTAFSAEEANRDNIGLILKIGHVDDEKAIERYRKELKDYMYIYFITDSLSREEVESLIAQSDVLVSLHRSEGFGLPVAEAMYLGTPVITTGWSATTEFTDSENACVVDCDMIILEKQIGNYEKGNRWADADIGQAAEYMRRLWQEPQYYSAHKERAMSFIQEHFNDKMIGEMIADRIHEIGN